MKEIKTCVVIGITLLITTMCNAQQRVSSIQNDFKTLLGTWQGSLTYRDYSSGKPYTMPADVKIKRVGKTNKFIFSNSYPNETSANSTDTITISTDGKYIDKEKIKSRRKLTNGDIEIITEELGKDGNDNKPATLRHIYMIGKLTYKKRKDVQFAGETEWITRHEYAYKKKFSME